MSYLNAWPIQPLATGWTVHGPTPGGGDFSTPVLASHGANPAFYTLSTGPFPGSTAAGKGLWPPTPFSAKFTERVDVYTCTNTKVRELIAVKGLHTSLLNTTVVAFKILPLGSYAPMTAPSPPFKTILELVLWNGLQSCRCITPDVIHVIKMPSFQYLLYLRKQEKVTGARCGE